jgi:hypothetical protein
MQKQRVAALSQAVTCLFFSLLTLTCWYSENEITGKAFVYGTAWNMKGEVTGILLLTTDGDELFVVHNAFGDELLKLVEQNVKVSGAVLVDQQGRNSITVYKYEISYN